MRSLLAVGALVALTACGQAPPADTGNTDPRLGSVFVDDDGSTHTTKRCDGPTLIYISKTMQGVSTSAVANSPECSR